MIETPAYCVFTATVGSNWFDNALGWLIRQATEGECNHAAIIYWSLEWESWLAVGADGNGLIEQTLGRFLESRKIVALYRPVGFSLWDGMRAHVADLDKGYNYSGLIGMALVEIAKRLDKHPRHNILSNSADIFCSQWVAEIIRSAIGLLQPPPGWSLANIDEAIVDPQTLMEAEARSRLFAETDAGLLALPWQAATVMPVLPLSLPPHQQ